MLVQPGLELVPLVGALVDLAQGLLPLAVEGLVAGADARELELHAGVLDRGIGRSRAMDLPDLTREQHRRAGPGAEEVLLVLPLQLVELVVEDLQFFLDVGGDGRRHGASWQDHRSAPRAA